MLVFLQVTNRLPLDLKQKIWNEVNDVQECPPAPIKKTSNKLENMMKTWRLRKIKF